MADQFEDITRQGLGGNLKNSIVGALVGLVLFIVSFPVLWLNEGRTDVSKVAARAIAVSPDAVDPKGEGKLVSVTGTLTTSGEVGDSDFVKPGPWVRLVRTVEMWAWVERRESTTEKKLGGSSETRTVYTYEKQWTQHPRPPSEFKHPDGHENPEPAVTGGSWSARRASIGAYGFHPADADLPSSSQLSLDPSMLLPSKAKLAGDFLFMGKGTLDAPELGDLRIAYRALRPGGTVTAFGQAQGAELVAFVHDEDSRLFRVLDGTREHALATMHHEYTTVGWLVRIVGFVLMWVGLGLLFGPLNALLDIVPFLGSLGRFLSFLAMLPIALGLSLLVVAISIVAHSPVLLAVTVVGVLGALVILARRRKGGPPTKSR